MANEQVEAVFRGRVQGVGFRYTTAGIARRYQISGFVRNEPDGSVRVVAEGARSELHAFLFDLEYAMGHYIGAKEYDWKPASGAHQGFRIAF